MLTLLFDLCQLGALLDLTGGLGNPFALLIMAPVTISASVLSLRATDRCSAVAAAADHHPARRASTCRWSSPSGEALALPEVLAARQLGGAGDRHRVPRDLCPAGDRRDLLDVAGAGRDADGARARAAALGARRRGGGRGARTRHAARHDQARRDRAGRGAGRPAAPAGGRRAGARPGRPLHRDPPRRWARAARRTRWCATRPSPAWSRRRRRRTPTAASASSPASRARRSRTGRRCSRWSPRRPEIIQGLRNLVQNAVDFAALDGLDRPRLERRASCAWRSATTVPAIRRT